MSFAWFVALRYLREGRAQTLLILAAVSVGVSVIVFLSALINGLQENLLKQTLGTQPHITLVPEDVVARPLFPAGTVATVLLEKAPQRLQPIDQWSSILEQVELVPGVVAASPTVTGAAFATRGVADKPVLVRGIDPESFLSVIDLRPKMKAGRLELASGDVVVGTGLAELLGLALGDKLRLSTAGGRDALVTVRGLFDVGNKEANDRWVFTSLRGAQTLFDLPGGVSALELRVNDIFSAEAIGQELSGLLGLKANSWMAVNAQLLVGLRSQNSSKYMIQFFVVVAVTLGIASVLIVSVVQKSREIGILRAVGTSAPLVRRVFLLQGAVLGALGSVLGCALGAGFALSFERLAANPDGSPTFPVALDADLFLRASALATGIGLLAAWLPARRASRLDPATVIRNG